MCWYIAESLPGPLKKLVPKLRSKNNISSAPASTGVEARIITDVVRIDQQNNGMRVMVMPGVRMLRMVTMKLIAPTSDDVPMMTRPMIHRSVPGDLEKMLFANGLY